MAADKPADGCSHHKFGCVMLPGAEARRPNHRGEPVGKDNNRLIVVILMCDHRSESKASDGVAGRKCVAAVKEMAASVSFEGALPAGGDFENFRHNQTVH